MRRYRVEVGGCSHVIDVDQLTDTRFRVVVGGKELDVTLSAAEDLPEAVISPDMADVADGNGDSHAAPTAASFRPAPPDALRSMVAAAPPPKAPPAPSPAAMRGSLTAPMPGTITAVEVRAGDRVTTGQVLVKLEAMKMVNAIKAPRDGVVASVVVEPGRSVTFGQTLVTFQEG